MLVLYELQLIKFLHIKGVEECCSLLVFWEEINVTIELLHNHFTDNQPQAYSIGINALVGVFDSAKHLEHFYLVFTLDAQTVVYDANAKLGLATGAPEVLYLNCYFTLSAGKLHSITIQVKEYLLKSFKVRFHNIACLIISILYILFEIKELLTDENLLKFGLIFLHGDDVLDGFSDVEMGVVGGEVGLVFVQDGEVENVMHKKVYELGGWRHLFAANDQTIEHLL